MGNKKSKTKAPATADVAEQNKGEQVSGYGGGGGDKHLPNPSAAEGYGSNDLPLPPDDIVSKWSAHECVSRVVHWYTAVPGLDELFGLPATTDDCDDFPHPYCWTMYGGPKYVEALVNARNASEAVDRSVDLPDLTIDTTGEVSTLEVTAARLSEALTPEHSPLDPVFEIGLMVANAFAHLADDLGVAHAMFRYPYTRVTHTAPTYHSVARSHLNGRARRPQGFSLLVSVERGGMVPHGHPVDPETGMVPPEVYNEATNVSDNVSVWVLGGLLWRLVTGQHPYYFEYSPSQYDDLSQYKTVERETVLGRRLDFGPWAVHTLLDVVVRRMFLARNPADRPSPAQAVAIIGVCLYAHHFLEGEAALARPADEAACAAWRTAAIEEWGDFARRCLRGPILRLQPFASDADLSSLLRMEFLVRVTPARMADAIAAIRARLVADPEETDLGGSGDGDGAEPDPIPFEYSYDDTKSASSNDDSDVQATAYVGIDPEATLEDLGLTVEPLADAGNVLAEPGNDPEWSIGSGED